ncbi:hypothetical protein HOLleu_39426 [Holothuria leucospilota]|uniref:Uncharacterized protein n=1 Tax=Holothuria leucospilota TaxID=206669 RepID=A0A9Q0YG59_HOLLE|nr:hypothetical protein HOLleu_39426 [Holothuria leucospilota]
MTLPSIPSVPSTTFDDFLRDWRSIGLQAKVDRTGERIGDRSPFIMSHTLLLQDIPRSATVPLFAGKF